MKAIVFIHDDKPDRNGDQVEIDGLSFPHVVPLRINFAGDAIGTAKLQREGKTIVADMQTTSENCIINLFPAIGFRCLESAMDGAILKINKAEVTEVSLCLANADARIQPLDFIPAALQEDRGLPPVQQTRSMPPVKSPKETNE